jgi:thioredoxin 1
MTKHFDDTNFQTEVLEASKTKPVLVDFYAEWCTPCKMQGPIVDKLAAEMDGKAIIGKVNTEEAQQTSATYGVMSIPTLIIFKDGKPMATMVGLQHEDMLKEALEKYL